MTSEPVLTSMAAALVFGTSFCATAALTARGVLRRDVRLWKTSFSSRSSALDTRSLTSVYALLVQVSILGLILFYAYLCEHHPPHAHGDKHYDRDQFFFFVLLLFVFASFTIRAGPSDDLLSRDQTEEWKGWMQVSFLLYHYAHAEEVYNAIRIMITCCTCSDSRC